MDDTVSIPEVREGHITRNHDYGCDCWCNPLVLTLGIPLVMSGTAIIVRSDPIGANQLALHCED